jgi:hypothetical protein
MIGFEVQVAADSDQTLTVLLGNELEDAVSPGSLADW